MTTFALNNLWNYLQGLSLSERQRMVGQQVGHAKQNN